MEEKNRKRKCPKITHISTNFSSEDEEISTKKVIVSPPLNVTVTDHIVQNESFVDLDKSQEDTFAYTNVRTVEEAYKQYKTFAPIEQVLPEMAKPPDTPRVANFSHNMQPEAIMNLMTACVETNTNSNPKYSLVTLHSVGDRNLPTTHLSMQIYPDLIQASHQNVIPEINLFIYELLLLDNTLPNYQSVLENFVGWAQNRNAPILFTVPIEFEEDLIRAIPNLKLQVIHRPFQEIHYTSTIT
jgi:hypothetical protein